MTASTGKTSAGVNDITLHSAFHLPIKSGSKSYGYKKPGGEIVHLLRNKYQYLKVLIIDEIFMIGREKFEHLDLALQAIKQRSFPFGRVSLVVVGDFLRRHLLIKKVCLKKQERVHIGQSTDGCGKEFWLHEMAEIVRQSSDPDVVQLLNMVPEGQQMNNDLIQVKALANTDTTTWPNEFVKVYLSNYLAGLDKEDPKKTNF